MWPSQSHQAYAYYRYNFAGQEEVLFPRKASMIIWIILSV